MPITSPARWTDCVNSMSFGTVPGSHAGSCGPRWKLPCQRPKKKPDVSCAPGCLCFRKVSAVSTLVVLEQFGELAPMAVRYVASLVKFFVDSTASRCLVTVPGDQPTIQAAIDAAVLPGCLVLVSPGTYRESVTITRSVSLVGLSGPSEQPPTVVLEGDGARHTGISISNTSDVQVRNFLIQNFEHEGILLDSVADSRIQRNVIRNPAIPKQEEEGHGILLRWSDRNVITENAVLEMADGIELHASDGNVIQINQIRRNKSLPVPCAGMRLFDSGENVIEQNVLAENGEASPGDAGILVADSSSGNVIRGNTLRSNVGGGNGGLTIESGCTGNTVEGNTASGNRDYGVLLDLVDDNPDCDANTWRNNVFGVANQPCICEGSHGAGTCLPYP